MARIQLIAEPGVPQILIAREFEATRDLLFRAHVDPELLVQWLRPREMTMSVDCLEARDGGKWRFTHRDAEGNEYGFHGFYHGTPSPNGIVQTFEYEGTPGHVSLHTLTFERHNGRTLLRTNAVFQSVADRDAMIESGMDRGINDAMAMLDAVLVGRDPPSEAMADQE